MEVIVKSVEIANGVYWLGRNAKKNGINYNPYLIIDDGEGILIDPGSVLDFEEFYSNVIKFISLEKIKYVILHKQDPDFCATIPLFEQKGLQAQIITHSRTAVIAKYYGIKSPYYMVNKNEYKLTLSSGRTLMFLPTPYLHFPGAITTYDMESKILFSSNLFGTFSKDESKKFGEEDYMESMKAFHEQYIPRNEMLIPVMKKFLDMDISIIAPQHGRVIKNDINTYIKALHDLECGHTVKKEIRKVGGYLGICNQIIKKFQSIFEIEELKRILGNEHIELHEETGLIKVFYCTDQELWNKIFEVVYKEKGTKALTIIEPLVQRLVQEYDISLPEIFNSKIIQGKKEAIKLSEQNKKLIELNLELKRTTQEIQDKLTKCPITGLYNEKFFESYLDIMISKRMDSALLLVGIDNMNAINLEYGSEIGNESISNVSYILKNKRQETHEIFKLKGVVFAYCIPDTNKEEAVTIAEDIRTTIAESGAFIQKLTVSIGLVYLDEIKQLTQNVDYDSKYIYNIAINRLKTARSKGTNIVYSEVKVDEYISQQKKALIVDTDDMNLEILKASLENEGIKAFVARDGVEALNIMGDEKINIVISELMLPKLDGFLIKEKMSMNSDMAKIPFIFMSHQKSQENVERSLSLNIDQYFKKPYMLTELIGIVKSKVKGEV